MAGKWITDRNTALEAFNIEVLDVMIFLAFVRN